MKRVIDGKHYDTEKAERIGVDGYSDGGDFHYWKEELYRTKKGNYFLYGEGGPLSDYAVDVGNGSTSGSRKLIPMSEEETLEWLERAEETVALEKYFPDYFEEA